MTTLIAVLLGILVALNVFRIYLTHRGTSKKSHFKQKLEATAKMVWDLEFKKFKTKEIRESVRVEYDNSKSRLSSIEEQIKNFKGEEGEKARLEDAKVLIERDITRFEQQLKALDMEVEGLVPSKDYPDGYQGIEHQIDSLQELKTMLKDWIKQQ